MTDQAGTSNLIRCWVDLDEEEALAHVGERLDRGDDPIALLEDCQEAMRRVGERYERREYYLSGLMMAGEIFRRAMELVEPALVDRLRGGASGHILLATVQGDIHDIGKNIFSIMLRCRGFTVTDLGVDVPPQRFLEAARRYHPDVVAMSGLLTVSYDAMRDTVALVRREGGSGLSDVPCIIGGGLLDGKICAYAGADFWAIDAMLGVEVCHQIMASRSDAADL